MKIIVLANSRREGNRCLAGISLETSEWVRPVHIMELLDLDTLEQDDPEIQEPQENGSVSKLLMRKQFGRMPKLLDIIDIPLYKTGNEDQPEDMEIQDGEWISHGRAGIEDLDKYVDNSGVILHNNSEYLTKAEASKKLSTLQLIKTEKFEIWEEKYNKLKGRIHPQGLELTITDPLYSWKHRNKNTDRNRGACYLTVSLAGSFMGRGFRQPRHYKLIAGVIEIEGEDSNG